MQRSVTTTYLEMTSRAQHQPSDRAPSGFEVVRAQIACPELNRFFYTTVGGRWSWYSRLPWEYDRWHAYLNRPELETWVAYVAGTPAGYFELEVQADRSVEIVYFGLLPSFVGKGLGGPLLSRAVSRAWDLEASRVWVHTCSLDHPAALLNYESRGFQIYRIETSEEEIPDSPPDQWLPTATSPDRASRP